MGKLPDGNPSHIKKNLSKERMDSQTNGIQVSVPRTKLGARLRLDDKRVNAVSVDKIISWVRTSLMEYDSMVWDER